VLRGVRFTLQPGTVLQLRGANGAGKTSLLRTLCGFLHPEEGRVLWNGRNVLEDLREFHSHVAYLGHEPPLKGDLTALENLRYWVGTRQHLATKDYAAALSQVEAGKLGDRLVRTLSAGQKRRIALAGLTLLGASLWLLDEPTTNLDTAGQGLVATLLENHVRAGGLAVAAVHHELSTNPTNTQRLELESA